MGGVTEAGYTNVANACQELVSENVLGSDGGKQKKSGGEKDKEGLEKGRRRGSKRGIL